jgi:uncharacterized protein
MQRSIRVIDSDGHIGESYHELLEWLPADYAGAQRDAAGLFYWGDPWPRAMTKLEARTALGKPVSPRREVTAQTWEEFLDQAGIEMSVLYPSDALSINGMRMPAYGAALARAYNDWMYHKFLRGSSRLRAVATLSLEDPEAAAEELRRAVTELGMVGGGLWVSGLARHLGNERYFPLYAEAERLGVPLAVHAVSAAGLAIANLYDSLIQVRTLSHGANQMIQMVPMMFSGVFDLFPRLKVAFLEAGCGWAIYLMDRMDLEFDKRGAVYAPRCQRRPSEVLQSGNIFIHTEVDEPTLVYAIQRFGRNDVFPYASDYPHEPADQVIHELDEFFERTDLTDDDKRGVLCTSVERLYNLAAVPATA